jgi:hypothetical protein
MGAQCPRIALPRADANTFFIDQLICGWVVEEELLYDLPTHM